MVYETAVNIWIECIFLSKKFHKIIGYSLAFLWPSVLDTIAGDLIRGWKRICENEFLVSEATGAPAGP